MTRCLAIFVAGCLVVPAAGAAPQKGKTSCLAPYGLRRSALGPARAPNFLRAVRGIARAGTKCRKDLEPREALPGALGGSGDFRSGNVYPLYRRARQRLAPAEDSVVMFARDLITKDFPILVLVAFEYPDGKSR